MVSAQPEISKWWWNGAIRKTRTLRALKTAIWMHHRDHLDHEQAGDHDQQHLGAGQDRQPGDQTADGQRAGVAHHDPGRVRVPPEEPDAAADRGRGDDRDVDRVPDLVAALQCRSAQQAALQALRNWKKQMAT